MKTYYPGISIPNGQIERGFKKVAPEEKGILLHALAPSRSLFLGTLGKTFHRFNMMPGCLPFVRLFLVVLFLGTSTFLRANPVDLSKYSKPVRVACVGDSITDGFGVGRDWSYPLQMGRMLGPKWWVANFGATGTTMLKQGDDPYWKHGQWTDALKFNPDVVIIALGTNDTKANNWQHKDLFINDYREMIATFQALPSKPLIYVCLPPPVTGTGNMGIPATGPAETGPMIRQMAGEIPCDVIDFYTPLVDHPEWQPDHIHPDPDGDFALAKIAFLALTGTTYQGTMVLTSQAPQAVPFP